MNNSFVFLFVKLDEYRSLQDVDTPDGLLASKVDANASLKKHEDQFT